MWFFALRAPVVFRPKRQPVARVLIPIQCDFQRHQLTIITQGMRADASLTGAKGPSSRAIPAVRVALGGGPRIGGDAVPAQ